MIDIATRLGDRYRIEARIGGGGMADVFEARDEALDRDVAIKLLRGIDDQAAARRFAEEIRLTARLNHPNVVRLFDAGEHDGSPYLVLERVTGGTLAAQMADGPLAARHVAAIGRQIAAALEHAHAEGIVHRDVKPSNVLLTADGTVRLADFGIALTATATRLTVAGSVAGSAGYVSPEQVLGTGTGAPADVYALGLVLLECLTGEPPWTGTTVEVALARITADPPIPDTLDDGWRGLLTAMTARQPDERPTMGLVAAALADLEAGRVSPLFPPPVPVRDRRNLRVPVAVASVLLVVAGAFGVLSLRDPVAPSASTATNPMEDAIAASVVRGAAVSASPSAAARPAASQRTGEADRREPTRQRPPTRPSGGTTSSGAVTRPQTTTSSSGSTSTRTTTTSGSTSGGGDTTSAPRETAEDTSGDGTATGDGDTTTDTKVTGKSRRDQVRPTDLPIPKKQQLNGTLSGPNTGE